MHSTCSNKCVPLVAYVACWKPNLVFIMLYFVYRFLCAVNVLHSNQRLASVNYLFAVVEVKSHSLECASVI